MVQIMIQRYPPPSFHLRPPCLNCGIPPEFLTNKSTVTLNENLMKVRRALTRQVQREEAAVVRSCNKRTLFQGILEYLSSFSATSVAEIRLPLRGQINSGPKSNHQTYAANDADPELRYWESPKYLTHTLASLSAPFKKDVAHGGVVWTQVNDVIDEIAKEEYDEWLMDAGDAATFRGPGYGNQKELIISDSRGGRHLSRLQNSATQSGDQLFGDGRWESFDCDERMVDGPADECRGNWGPKSLGPQFGSLRSMTPHVQDDDYGMQTRSLLDVSDVSTYGRERLILYVRPQCLPNEWARDLQKNPRRCKLKVLPKPTDDDDKQGVVESDKNWQSMLDLMSESSPDPPGDDLIKRDVEVKFDTTLKNMVKSQLAVGEAVEELCLPSLVHGSEQRPPTLQPLRGLDPFVWMPPMFVYRLEASPDVSTSAQDPFSHLPTLTLRLGPNDLVDDRRFEECVEIAFLLPNKPANCSRPWSWTLESDDTGQLHKRTRRGRVQPLKSSIYQLESWVTTSVDGDDGLRLQCLPNGVEKVFKFISSRKAEMNELKLDHRRVASQQYKTYLKIRRRQERAAVRNGDIFAFGCLPVRALDHPDQWVPLPAGYPQGDRFQPYYEADEELYLYHSGRAQPDRYSSAAAVPRRSTSRQNERRRYEIDADRSDRERPGDRGPFPRFKYQRSRGGNPSSKLRNEWEERYERRGGIRGGAEMSPPSWPSGGLMNNYGMGGGRVERDDEEDAEGLPNRARGRKGNVENPSSQHWDYPATIKSDEQTLREEELLDGDDGDHDGDDEGGEEVDGNVSSRGRRLTLPTSSTDGRDPIPRRWSQSRAEMSATTGELAWSRGGDAVGDVFHGVKRALHGDEQEGDRASSFVGPAFHGRDHHNQHRSHLHHRYVTAREESMSHRASARHHHNPRYGHHGGHNHHHHHGHQRGDKRGGRERGVAGRGIGVDGDGGDERDDIPHHGGSRRQAEAQKLDATAPHHHEWMQAAFSNLTGPSPNWRSSCLTKLKEADDWWSMPAPYTWFQVKQNPVSTDDMVAMETYRLKLSGWSLSEIRCFLEKYLMHPKDFKRISQALENKSLKDCVDFYYRCKHQFRLKDRVQLLAERGQENKERKVKTKKQEQRGSLVEEAMDGLDDAVRTLSAFPFTRPSCSLELPTESDDVYRVESLVNKTEGGETIAKQGKNKKDEDQDGDHTDERWAQNDRGNEAMVLESVDHFHRNLVFDKDPHMLWDVDAGSQIATDEVLIKRGLLMQEGERDDGDDDGGKEGAGKSRSGMDAAGGGTTLFENVKEGYFIPASVSQLEPPGRSVEVAARWGSEKRDLFTVVDGPLLLIGEGQSLAEELEDEDNDEDEESEDEEERLPRENGKRYGGRFEDEQINHEEDESDEEGSMRDVDEERVLMAKHMGRPVRGNSGAGRRSALWPRGQRKRGRSSARSDTSSQTPTMAPASFTSSPPRVWSSQHLSPSRATVELKGTRGRGRASSISPSRQVSHGSPQHPPGYKRVAVSVSSPAQLPSSSLSNATSPLTLQPSVLPQSMPSLPSNQTSTERQPQHSMIPARWAKRYPSQSSNPLSPPFQPARNSERSGQDDRDIVDEGQLETYSPYLYHLHAPARYGMDQGAENDDELNDGDCENGGGGLGIFSSREGGMFSPWFATFGVGLGRGAGVTGGVENDTEEEREETDFEGERTGSGEGEDGDEAEEDRDDVEFHTRLNGHSRPIQEPTPSLPSSQFHTLPKMRAPQINEDAGLPAGQGSLPAELPLCLSPQPWLSSSDSQMDEREVGESGQPVETLNLVSQLPHGMATDNFTINAESVLQKQVEHTVPRDVQRVHFGPDQGPAVAERQPAAGYGTSNQEMGSYPHTGSPASDPSGQDGATDACDRSKPAGSSGKIMLIGVSARSNVMRSPPESITSCPGSPPDVVRPSQAMPPINSTLVEPDGVAGHYSKPSLCEPHPPATVPQTDTPPRTDAVLGPAPVSARQAGAQRSTHVTKKRRTSRGTSNRRAQLSMHRSQDTKTISRSVKIDGSSVTAKLGGNFNTSIASTGSRKNQFKKSSNEKASGRKGRESGSSQLRSQQSPLSSSDADNTLQLRGGTLSTPSSPHQGPIQCSTSSLSQSKTDGVGGCMTTQAVDNNTFSHDSIGVLLVGNTQPNSGCRPCSGPPPTDTRAGWAPPQASQLPPLTEVTSPLSVNPPHLPSVYHTASPLSELQPQPSTTCEALQTTSSSIAQNPSGQLGYTATTTRDNDVRAGTVACSSGPPTACPSPSWISRSPTPTIPSPPSGLMFSHPLIPSSISSTSGAKITGMASTSSRVSGLSSWGVSPTPFLQCQSTSITNSSTVSNPTVGAPLVVSSSTPHLAVASSPSQHRLLTDDSAAIPPCSVGVPSTTNSQHSTHSSGSVVADRGPPLLLDVNICRSCSKIGTIGSRHGGLCSMCLITANPNSQSNNPPLPTQKSQQGPSLSNTVGTLQEPITPFASIACAGVGVNPTVTPHRTSRPPSPGHPPVPLNQYARQPTATPLMTTASPPPSCGAVHAPPVLHAWLTDPLVPHHTPASAYSREDSSLSAISPVTSAAPPMSCSHVAQSISPLRSASPASSPPLSRSPPPNQLSHPPDEAAVPLSDIAPAGGLLQFQIEGRARLTGGSLTDGVFSSVAPNTFLQGHQLASTLQPQPQVTPPATDSLGTVSTPSSIAHQTHSLTNPSAFPSPVSSGVSDPTDCGLPLSPQQTVGFPAHNDASTARGVNCQPTSYLSPPSLVGSPPQETSLTRSGQANEGTSESEQLSTNSLCSFPSSKADIPMKTEARSVAGGAPLQSSTPTQSHSKPGVSSELHTSEISAQHPYPPPTLHPTSSPHKSYGSSPTLSALTQHAVVAAPPRGTFATQPNGSDCSTTTPTPSMNSCSQSPSPKLSLSMQPPRQMKQGDVDSPPQPGEVGLLNGSQPATISLSVNVISSPGQAPSGAGGVGRAVKGYPPGQSPPPTPVTSLVDNTSSAFSYPLSTHALCGVSSTSSSSSSSPASSSRGRKPATKWSEYEKYLYYKKISEVGRNWDALHREMTPFGKTKEQCKNFYQNTVSKGRVEPTEWLINNRAQFEDAYGQPLQAEHFFTDIGMGCNDPHQVGTGLSSSPQGCTSANGVMLGASMPQLHPTSTAGSLKGSAPPTVSSVLPLASHQPHSSSVALGRPSTNPPHTTKVGGASVPPTAGGSCYPHAPGVSISSGSAAEGVGLDRGVSISTAGFCTVCATPRPCRCAALANAWGVSPSANPPPPVVGATPLWPSVLSDLSPSANRGGSATGSDRGDVVPLHWGTNNPGPPIVLWGSSANRGYEASSSMNPPSGIVPLFFPSSTPSSPPKSSSTSSASLPSSLPSSSVPSPIPTPLEPQPPLSDASPATPTGTHTHQT
eukprot:GHVN01001015.1.p1 GENE.GHVN01001015.1~~GHVN01001015.1.p1  ORF type:complete len:3386 (-),score=611.43 GHVN01001015.1:8673-18830(-)